VADSKVATGSAALNTSTGSQDLTIAGLGWTPKAIWVIGTVALTDETEADHWSYSSTYADDNGNVVSIMGAAETAQATTDTNRYGYAAGTVGNIEDGTGAIDCVFEIASDDATAGPISNGWRIDVTNAPTSAYRVVYVLFGGADLDPVVGSSSVGGTISPGHSPELVFAEHIGTTFSASVQAHRNWGVGFSDGTNQKSMATLAVDAAVATQVTGRLDSLQAISKVGSGAFAWQGDIDTFDATSFDMDLAASSGEDVAYLSLDLGGLSTKVMEVSSPTSTSVDWTHTGVGFTPAAMIMWGSVHTAMNTVEVGGRGGAPALIVYDGTRQFCLQWCDDDPAGTTDSSSRWSDKLVTMAGDAGGTLLWDIDLASSPFNSDGFTIPASAITATNGTARKWIAVFFGEPTGGADTGTLAATERADTAAFTASYTGPQFTGTTALTERPDTVAFTASYTGPQFTGTTALTERADTIAWTAAYEPPPPPPAADYGGTMSATERADTIWSGPEFASLWTATYTAPEPPPPGPGTHIPSAVMDRILAIINDSTLAIDIEHYQMPGDVLASTFKGFALQTHSDESGVQHPKVYAASNDDFAPLVVIGDVLRWSGSLDSDGYTVRNIGFDGWGLLEFVLEAHLRSA